MRTNNSKAAAAEGARYLAIGTAALAVGAPAAWLATAWALSQAAAAASAGQPAEGWILAMRPVLIPVSMMVAWFAARGSSSRGWARAVRILGIGAAVSVVVVFLDGFMSAGF